MDNNFRLQMAQMGHPQMGTYTEGRSSSMHSNAAASGSGYSDVGSVTPSSYSTDTLQLDHDLEFFSQNSGYGFNQHNE